MLEPGAISFQIERMKGKTGERLRPLRWALPASLFLHVLIAAFLVYGLPRAALQPDEERPINVAIVAPLAQPKPEPPPRPPIEPKAEKPPAPQVEKRPEQTAEKPLQPEQPRKPSPVEVLKPVFQYGDKDIGPRKSPDGASAQDNAPSARDGDAKPPVAPNQPADTVDAKDAANATNIGKDPANAASEAEPAQEMPKQAPSSQDADQPSADETHNDKQPAAAPTPLAALGGQDEIELPAVAETPKPKPANTPKPGPATQAKSASGRAGKQGTTNGGTSLSYSGLPGVRRLRSQGATGDVLATTAIAGLPRDERVSKLCASVLRQELLDAAYVPEWVRFVPLQTGNILNDPNAAVRATGTWHRLSLRCEVDTDATRVLAFNYRLGPLITPGEQVRLGLPRF